MNPCISRRHTHGVSCLLKSPDVVIVCHCQCLLFLFLFFLNFNQVHVFINQCTACNDTCTHCQFTKTNDNICSRKAPMCLEEMTSPPLVVSIHTCIHFFFSFFLVGAQGHLSPTFTSLVKCPVQRLQSRQLPLLFHRKTDTIPQL